MKRYVWLSSFLVIAMLASASANTIIIGLAPNDGSGDNFGIIEQGNDFTITVHGGVLFEFFNVFGYAPGTTLGGTVPVFFSSGTIQLGSAIYDLSFNGTGTLFMSSFALPANGQNFSTSVQLTFSTLAMIAATGQSLPISGSAIGTLSVTFDSQSGLYFPGTVIARATTVPEPNTLALMGTGLVAAISVVRRRINSSR